MTAPNIAITYTDPDNGDDDARLAGLLSFLQDEERRSFDDSLNDERAVCIDFYNGEPFGDEEDGRSQYVTRDVAEVVDQGVASLESVMLSGDSAVEFDTQDKRLGKAITAAVGKEFFQGQDGYRVLHDWIKAGLLEKTSVAKVCIEPQPPKREEMTVPVEAMVLLQQEQKTNPKGPQIIAAEPVDETEEQWRIAVAIPQPPLFRDYIVPNEEMGIAQDARDLDDACEYSVYKMPKTISQIAQMGYLTEGLQSDSNDDGGVLSQARDGDFRASTVADYRTGPNRRVWLLEEYARYDLDGDGITELVKVHRVGGVILNVEPMDEQPGVIWCPFPMPGRIVGQGLADKVMDIQRGRSVLFRQGLDNLYQSNAPRWTLHTQSISDDTIDDLLSTPRAGQVIRHQGNSPPMPVSIPFVAGSAFETAQVLAGEKEARTGITRLNQGIDKDTLNQTASGTAMMMTAGQQMEDYMVRNLAEAFGRLMLKKYRLMRKFGGMMTVFVDGEEIQTDPKTWPDDAKIRVRVGLGTGRKDQRLAHRMNLLQITAQARQDPEYGRMVTPQNLYNQIAGVIEDSSLGMVSEFISDPTRLPPVEPQPNPDMVKAEADAKLQAAKLQGDQQAAEAGLQIKAQDAALTLDLKREEAAAKIMLMREEMAAKLELERERAASEAALAVRQQDFEMAMARENMALQREQAEHKAGMAEQAVQKNRPGGDLDK